MEGQRESTLEFRYQKNTKRRYQKPIRVETIQCTVELVRTKARSILMKPNARWVNANWVIRYLKKPEEKLVSQNKDNLLE